LQVARATFDEVVIATIHGFCNRILSDYAFECGRRVGLELVKESRFFTSIVNNRAIDRLERSDVAEKDRKDFRWAEYSFGKFEDGELINWFGRYFYSANFLQGIDIPPKSGSFFINRNF